MKKLITLIIMSLFTQGAAGCGSQTAVEETTEPAANIEENKKKEAYQTTEQTKSDSDFIDSVEYTVERTDYSIYNDNGEPLIYLYYDAVQITDDIPNKDEINAAIVQCCEEVFERNGGLESFKEYLEFPGCSPDCPFKCTMSYYIANNSDGIFSIVMILEWYMGGVMDYGYEGLTFDINEGKPADVKKLFNMSKEDLAKTMKEKMLEFMNEYPDGEWYYEKIENYTYDDFKWFIDDGQLMLALDKYEAAPGVHGGAIIDTGIYIDQE